MLLIEIVYQHHHAPSLRVLLLKGEAISTDNLRLIQRLLRYARNDALGLLSGELLNDLDYWSAWLLSMICYFVVY